MQLGRMAAGEPGVPGRFRWRGREFDIVEIVSSGKGYAREGHVPTGETYLRRHWLTVRTASGEEMTLYCERHVRGRKDPKGRWWLYTMREAVTPD